MGSKIAEVFPSRYIEIKDISSLITGNLSYLQSDDDYEEKDYFSSNEKALSAILPGYAILPEIYHEIFINPLEKLFRNNFSQVLQDIQNSSPDEREKEIPFRDWIDSIQQRNEGYLRPAMHGFQAVINDLFAGWLDAESRFGIKPPDNQIVPPLPRFANPEFGPYTVATSDRIEQQYRVKMSVVTMGPALSRNIALWGALAHECGHDITIADDGLLAECANIVYSQIFDSPELRGTEVVYNGALEPLAKRAAEVWRFWIVETVADVLGILNFGPSSAIAYATLAIPLRDGKLSNIGGANDVHPIDSLRIFLAADLVREITSFSSVIRNAWANALLRIIDKYIDNKDKFVLGWSTPSGFIPTVEFPFEPMRETTKIVARILAYYKLETLENHYLAEINTWADNDETIAVRIANDLLNNREPSLESQLGETEVFPAHLISGAIYALAESANIPAITDLTVSALSKSYDRNKMWSGFPLHYRRDFHMHRFLPSLRKSKGSRNINNAFVKAKSISGLSCRHCGRIFSTRDRLTIHHKKEHPAIL